MKKLVFLLCLLLAVPAFAQDRPISGTTVQTTDTTANSLLVGCAIGSTTCTGGIKSGPIVVNSVTVVNSSGQVPDAALTSNIPLKNAVNAFTAFGAHTFSAGNTGQNSLSVRNTSAGTTNSTALNVGNDASSTLLAIEAYSSTFTPGTYNLANGAAVFSTGAGGLSLMASHASGAIRFLTGGTTVRWGINTAGDFTIGTASHIFESNGTPAQVCAACTGASIAGIDAAFVLDSGSAGAITPSWVVTFGHTFSSVAICSATAAHASFAAYIGPGSASTTQVTITGVGTVIANTKVYVNCRSS